MEAGTQIPKLCATDMVDAFGSCRLCLIEIEGRAGTPASCTTPVMNGIVVHTQTERLKKLRKGDGVLHLRPSAGLPDLRRQWRLRIAGHGRRRRPARRARYEGENHVFAKSDGCRNDNWMPKDESNPYFTYDPRNASSARAASAPARKCKVPSH